MELIITGVALLSAALHPIRDSVLRSDTKPPTAYIAMIAVALLASITHLLVGQKNIAAVLDVWPLMAITLTANTVYSLSLVLTYSRGDLSTYYPITRSSPIFIVAVGVLFLGQTFSPAMLAGIALIVTGGFLLQRVPGQKLIYQPTTLCLALLVMASHGSGAIADGYAVRRIDPAVWFFWNYLSLSAVNLLLFRYVARKGLEWPPFAHWRRSWSRYLAGGIALYLSYYLILLAFSLGGNVAAVTAVRQASIPIAVLIGGVFLSEVELPRRLFFSVFIAIGIVIIVFAK